MSGTYGISVIDYGATGDGQTDDSAAIQAALDAGQRRVIVPLGQYLLGQGLRIGSDTQLLVHPSAILRFGDGAGRGPDDFLITNRDHQGGDRAIRIEGGIWDGNNPANPRGPDILGSYTGVMVNFTNMTGLTLRNMTLMDSESYFVRLGGVTGFLIEGIDFDIKALRPNQDGIHVSGHCHNGIIRHISGLGSKTPNDDMVAILADDALHRAQNQNGAFNGPISQVRVEHLRASSCHSFIRLLSVDHPIDDIELRDVEGGCVCSAINMDACRDCRVQLFDEADRPGGVGSITNIRASDFRVHKASDHSRQPLIDFRTRADNFRLERFHRNTDRDASPATPTMCIEKAGALDLCLEGLPDAPNDGPSTPMDMPTGQTKYRMTRYLDAEESFTLATDGFDLLEVTSDAPE